MTGREEMSHWSIYIKGVSFPQSREGLVDACRQNNAPETFLSELKKLPDKTYLTAADVGREIGRRKV